MNKNNDNENSNDKLNLNCNFFGYNLYSSTFSQSPRNRSISQKQIISKKEEKQIPSKIKNSSHKRNNSENMSNTIILNINENMRVMVRIRPPLPREIEYGIPFRAISEVSSDNKSLTIYEYLGSSNDELTRQHEFIQNPSLFQQHNFTFDYIFDQDSTQLELYIKTAKPSVLSLFEGYNSSIFAYGQTGTGKTYTMEGFTLIPYDEKRGLVPRVIEDIFFYINENKNKDINNNDIKYEIRASYLQIYNESISDLLIPEKKNLNIREDKKKGIFVDNLSEWIVKDSNDIYTLLSKGVENRATASTSMNEISSRSHAIFIIILEQNILKKEKYGIEINTVKKMSKLNLVDLAGSERTKISGAKGKQLEESKRINKSLSALGNVINALTELKSFKNNNINHIPYRDSKLTRLLEDSLGGNSITTMITMISPCQNFINETLSSLLFAKRAKKVKNKPKINEEKNSHQNLIKQYEIQLINLRNELEKKNEMWNNNLLIKQIQQLTEDKNNIIKQLDITNKKYLEEKNNNKLLEKNLENINKNKVNENKKIEETAEFKISLEKKQNLLLKEFENKLKEYENKKLNKNKNDNEEIERYKNLILKQREMMSSLTKKINEKDEEILQIQEDKDFLNKINEQQENYISLLNTNYKNLIDYCKNNINKENKDNINNALENYINIYKKINNEVLNKYEINNDKMNDNNKNKTAINNRKYLPYNYNIDINNNTSSLNSSMSSNTNLSNDAQMILLTPEEKIKELNNILKEKENEIKILKIFCQKFLSKSCETDESKIELELSKIKNFQNGFELHYKIREIEEEKLKLKKENEQLKEKLLEYQNNIFKIHNILGNIKFTDKENTNINDINNIVNLLINNNIDNLIKENKDNIENKEVFNERIQKMLSLKKENIYNSSTINNNSDFVNNSIGYKLKNENLAKISNSLNEIQLIKKANKKKDCEKKFINKCVNNMSLYYI